MTDSLAAGSAQVLELLTYIEQVEKLKTKPAFTVPTEHFVAYQHELQRLPELEFNLQSNGDDIWLRIPRLQEIAAPDVDDALRPWVSLPKTPEKTPTLRAELILQDNQRGEVRVPLSDHPEIQEAFDWYVEYQWEPWATAELPRRQTMARYQKLFALYQAIALEGAETALELVWGIGYAAWKKEGYATAVRNPVLLQICEVTLNEKNFDLEIRPRDVEPRLNADCYVEMGITGVQQLEAFWRSALASNANRINPFEISTHEPILKAAVGYLDPSGAYHFRDKDLSLPPPGERLSITNTWVLFGRKRSGDVFLEDIRRLKTKVEEAKALPSVVRGFVEHGGTEVRVRPEQPYRGLSTSEAGSGAMELYFPMPYNDEQVAIVQKLHANDGVVVQGPPGTGKTHTIANVICHYLAQGKRVLVTAKSETALAVLQEKLPDRIRPLCVALLSDERDGMKQFEHSIQTIATNVAALSPSRSNSNIESAEQLVNQLHARISNVDRTIAKHASSHMDSYTFQGRTVSPEDMAKLVLEQADENQWLDDDLPEGTDSLAKLTVGDINALRDARMRIGEGISYVGLTIPAPDAFPDWMDLLWLHRDVVQAKLIDTSVKQGDTLALANSSLEIFEKAQALVAFLVERKELQSKLQATRTAWIEEFSRRFADLPPAHPAIAALMNVCSDLKSLEAARTEMIAHAIVVPDLAERNEPFCVALDRLVTGKSAFLLPFGHGEARKLIGGVTITGRPPKTAEEWTRVQGVITWRKDAQSVLARWNSLSGDFGLDQVSERIDVAFRQAYAGQIIISNTHLLSTQYDANLHPKLAEVFGHPTADQMWDGGETFIAKIASSLKAHVEKSRLSYAMKRVQELLQKLEPHAGIVVDNVRAFFRDMLGQPNADEDAMEKRWSELHNELVRLDKLKADLQDINSITNRISAAGAPKWASRLRTVPASANIDPHTPVNWREAWTWRQAVMLLDKIDGHEELRKLFQDRRQLTTALARSYQDLVAEKTWLEVFNNSPDAVRQALQAYLNALQAMGAGTGVRAIRHRKTAREAMQRAYKAVPCWVLPHWRVSETIPPEIGLFDLVVVDEASQSDIWAFPSLLRGKKVLVVGDDKQVSPSAVGIAEEKVKDLVKRFLANQPHGSEMTPDKSIYDLARVVFAGNSVMLQEHFRCVPAIIEFSNRDFYQNQIRPLRVPSSSERLDPPLVDVFVKGGYCNSKDINEPEAKAIVDEIERILGDPLLAGRTIGVVTLKGHAQAAHIHDQVSRRISQADVLNRKISIGPPPVFQGRERDIMIISMVIGSQDRAAANKADMRQRFNVALSRARDRMYLFRSVSESDFADDTLNGRILSHFKQPFHQDVKKVQSLRERCESGFEFEMFDELTKRGYRVEPQVPCGGYRIDFVVEGSEGRRLAIECDGDRYHGPGRWQEDMARQRVLERAGWTFWRCFASTFVRRRSEVMSDLVGTLQQLGIEPLGAESVDNSVWVQFKEVDPYSVDQPEQEVA
jgi:very-short-patch-repair endonuclease